MFESIPERQPAILSLVYVAGLALMLVWLSVSLVRRALSKRASKASELAGVAAENLPRDVLKRLGATGTNRGLRALRFVFVVLAFVVLGFHVYWAHFAQTSNEEFEQLSYKDVRNRRIADSTLRGWILDRSGQLDRAFARYTRDEQGNIKRAFPFDSMMAHLLGSDRGDAGLERALFGARSGAEPEAWEVATGKSPEQQEVKDVRLTIDSRLQQAVVEQMRGRFGAVVILNPQTGEALAIYSNPSYSLNDVRDEASWIRLNADKRDSPLVNRALGSYYIPGSTFKTLTMIAAFNAGMQNTSLVGSPSGYVAQSGAKAILDDNGSCEVCGAMNIDTAYKLSSNQYFSQMAVKLGVERMKQTAQLVGIGTYDTSEEALRGRKLPDIWNASTLSVARALAPRESTIVTNPKIRPFDLALEGYGQGYAGQMTPFQMALIVSAVANVNGNLMKPKIEYDLKPQVFKQVTTPQNAATMRNIMGLVTKEGTGRAAFAPVTSAGISSGGKTGTAQKDVPVYDPQTGEPKTVKKPVRDAKGKIIGERTEVVLADQPRVDSWFLAFAPLETPQLTIAVIIEGGGYGAKTAAPIAANLVLKAHELGLLGNIGNNQPSPVKNKTPRAPKQNKRG
ncbi:MAG: penicillin-binding protein 2 [Pyrinomonadaceae bacterium]